MSEAHENKQVIVEATEDEKERRGTRLENPKNQQNQWFSGDMPSAALTGWRFGLFLIGSAALGGIAVAVWNRRLLSQMRRSSEQDPLFSDDLEGVDQGEE